VREACTTLEGKGRTGQEKKALPDMQLIFVNAPIAMQLSNM